MQCDKITILQIYRQKHCVNILYPANLPWEALREYPLPCKFVAGDFHVGNFTAGSNGHFDSFKGYTTNAAVGVVTITLIS
jgi:hypothetical protein